MPDEEFEPEETSAEYPRPQNEVLRPGDDIEDSDDDSDDDSGEGPGSDPMAPDPDPRNEW